MNPSHDLYEEQLSALDSARTIFVGDLSYFCNEDDLFNLFAKFGNILTVRVRRGVTGESLMHGFIAMDTAEAAGAAITGLDGIEFMGRNIRVQLSSDGQRNSISKDSLVQVHVSFISKQNSFLVTEKILRDIFSPYGAVADVAIKKHVAVPKQGRQSGYGFVYYFDINSAYRALQALKQNTVRDITLDCSISHKSETRIRQNQPAAAAAAPVYDRAAGLIPYPGNQGQGATVSPTGALPPAPYGNQRGGSRPPAAPAAYGNGSRSGGANPYGPNGSPNIPYGADPSALFKGASASHGRRQEAPRQHPMANVYNPSGAPPAYQQGTAPSHLSQGYYGQSPAQPPYAPYGSSRSGGAAPGSYPADLSADFGRLQVSSYAAGQASGPRHTLSGASRHSASSSPRAVSPRDMSPRSLSPRAGGYEYSVEAPLDRMSYQYAPSMSDGSFRTDSLSEYDSSFSRSRSRSPRARSPPLGGDAFGALSYGLGGLGGGAPVSNPFTDLDKAIAAANAASVGVAGVAGGYSLSNNTSGHSNISDFKQAAHASSSGDLLSGFPTGFNQRLSRSGSDNGETAAGLSNAFPGLVPQQLHQSLPQQRTPAGSTTESMSRQSVDSLLSNGSPAAGALLNDGVIRQYLLEEDFAASLEDDAALHTAAVAAVTIDGELEGH